MPTRKQRRRREKGLRHEYEVVYVDDEGNEVEPPPEERERAERSRSDRRPPERVRGRKADAAAPSVRGKPIQAPSWRRTIRRGAIFAPIFLATVLLLGGDRLTFAGAVVQTILLLIVFVPFSYFMDRVVYRSALKRADRPKR